jgi:hypothetical protein
MRRWHYLGWLAANVLAGCGDSDDGDADVCTPLVACGGDVVGAWRIEETCVDFAELSQAFEETLPAECAGSLTAAEADMVDLLITYTAEGTWTTEGSARNHLEYAFTASCLTAINANFPALSDSACDMLGQGTQSQVSMVDPAGVASCTLGTGACECENTFTLQAAGTGDYTLDADQIIIDGEPTPYCVTGDSMKFGNVVQGLSTARRQ